MKARVVAGVYKLAEPRTAKLVLTWLLVVLAVVGALMPGLVETGLLADPVSGGSGNG
ncbi:MAG TPA: hypothetical protein G4O00_04080 [Thermoflexia bacterium]|jgi:hypothetical protein|nr:hypothetical protein [Thermoflexia bacterium]